MHKLLQIYNAFRQYLLLFILLITLLILAFIMSKNIFVSNEHSTIYVISSTFIPSINEFCHISLTSPIPCGCPMKFNSKLINGQPANQAAWPWMVSYGPKRIHICGGVLIAPKYILTAAHCLHSNDDDEPIDFSNTEIRIVITSLNDITYENLFSIRKASLHNDFNPNTYKNDIALIRLDQSVIQMLCLPRFTSYIYLPLNTTVIAIAWGHLIDPNSVIPTHLQQTYLPVSPIITNLCFEQEIDSPDQQFCADYENGFSDICQGDSGSPLMKNIGKLLALLVME